MKKLLFGAAALMLGGVALGQTTSEGSEANFVDTPVLVTAGFPTIDASTIETADALAPSLLAPIPGPNTGYSTQNGNNNLVRARQAGDLNSMYATQDGDGNLVSMRQTGDTNNGGFFVSAIDNDAQSNQFGDNNDGRIEQQGDYNDAQVYQENTGAAGSMGNSADIQQGTAENAENNYAGIDQRGNENSARILQTWDNSDALALQSGTGNTVEIKQQADPENSLGQEALSEQLGSDNEGLIKQLSDGTSGRNYARLFQEGNNNKSDQTQTTSDNVLGNEALVNQGSNILLDDANTAAQFAAVNAVDNISNGIESQVSSYSEAIQVQSGHSNLAETHQFGDGNSAANGDYSKQVQDGEGNEAYAFQNIFGSPTGRGNSVEQTQMGDDNYVATGQNGRRNDITVLQDGDDNYAVSTQRGRDHIVDAHQTGFFNALETAQRGDMNTIVVRQDGDIGQSWKAEQNVPGGLPDGGNTLDVFQTTGFSGILPAIGTSQTANMVSRMALQAPQSARSGSGL
ncbi:hypothetical protein [Dokdonia sp. Hel_I_53]|uniref:hypothetical protein n=1 Tax=Dokdonia sp. Hel_I_53 TaxID=1566287 RepID=UPI001199FC4A|nr:hypothetical protein [Dokdonia sp. Hel_I_53]TVZ51732.1 Curlin associated repeat-containing protein [Dokdonia sp. Hel_I_53]